MTLRKPHLWLTVFAGTLLLLGMPAAHAFTFESNSGANGGEQKFDIEEQARNFKKQDEKSALGAATRDVQTPWGKGTLQFGVQQNATPFGSGFGATTVDRSHLDKMLAPPGLQHRFDR
jgi:hypothetical protein